ncbi:MAG: hypothetical protein ABFS32_11960 [Bacteroidota bacterium]
MNRILIYILVIMVVMPSCNKEDMTFTITPAIGFSDSGKTVKLDNSGDVEIFLSFSAPLESDASAEISVVGITGFIYGTDFTTEPAASGGIISLPLTAGSTEALVKYKGITQTIEDEIDMKVLFQLSGGTNISLGQAVTLDFTLTLKPPVAVEPVTISHDFEGCTEDYASKWKWEKVLL